MLPTVTLSWAGVVPVAGVTVSQFPPEVVAGVTVKLRGFPAEERLTVCEPGPLKDKAWALAEIMGALGLETTIESTAEPVAPHALTSTVNVYEPPAVGVPVMADPVRVRPGGREP